RRRRAAGAHLAARGLGGARRSARASPRRHDRATRGRGAAARAYGAHAFGVPRAARRESVPRGSCERPSGAALALRRRGALAARAPPPGRPRARRSRSVAPHERRHARRSPLGSRVGETLEAGPRSRCLVKPRRTTTSPAPHALLGVLMLKFASRMILVAV